MLFDKKLNCKFVVTKKREVLKIKGLTLLHNKKIMEIHTPFKVVAIDDSFKPNEIPLSKWIENNATYTVIEVVRLNIQGLVGFKLKEIDLTGCEPYNYFRCSRFRFYLKEDEMAEAKVKDLIGGIL